MIRLCLGIIFYAFVTGNCTELAGDLPGILTKNKSPYLVISDIYVPVGKIVKIEPGTVLLFKNFTGLHIHGVLDAKGMGHNNIVFTSENDHEFNPSSKLNPTPYDWNGIYIRNDGIGSEFENVKVQYSVKGIISETKFIRIINGIFNENGRSHLTIEGETKSVIVLMPYTHNLSVKDAVVDGVPVKILMDPNSKKRNFLRYAGLGLFVGGVAMGTGFAFEYKKAHDDFNAMCQENTPNEPQWLNNKYADLEWEKRQKRRNIQRNLMLGGFSTAIMGFLSFSYSFKF